MVSRANFTMQASTDEQDRFVEADEPLASFHRRCGGELPGPLVTPALLELVRKSRSFGMRLARQISAQNERESITAWVEVTPLGEGTSLALANWQTVPLREDAAVASSTHRIAMARQTGELSLRLGEKQEVLAVLHASDALAELARNIGDNIGCPWTDFVTLRGNAHEQPLHWRLLDGASLSLEGSAREWTACLVPFGRHQPGSDGFELHLVPEEAAIDPAIETANIPQRAEGIGKEIAPVLRQPVSRIIANAETIRTQLAGPLSEEYSEYARDITSAGEHLLALIDDLTTLEQVEDENFTLSLEQIDLAEIAQRAAGILRVRAKERGITIDAPKPGEVALATGEFRRVLQILLNLLGNAIRYSPEGADVWIRSEVEDGHAMITVFDQGEGLDKEEQIRAFAKFERLGRRDDGGSGLGLYISRRLAEAMSGTLTVESAKGQGARFTLALPLALSE